MQTQILQAVETLKNGGIILLPTETVYGIAADARNKSAIERIYEIKARDYSKPLQVMVTGLDEAEKIAVFNDRSRRLAEEFWPGALTIVLKIRPKALPNNFNRINDTVGIRVPNHPLAYEILKQAGFPLVVTSANISGRESNISFSEAKRSLGKRLDLLIDGGDSEIGISSTVIDVTNEKYPKVLRQGSIRV